MAIIRDSAFEKGAVAGKGGVEGKQRGGGVRAGGGGGVLGGLHKGSEAPPRRQRVGARVAQGDVDFRSAVVGRARAREEDERAGRVRAIPQLRGELVDCGAKGGGDSRGSNVCINETQHNT